MHDWLQMFHGGHTIFPLTEIAVKAIVAISIGLLVGFEREWANKDIGVRTFALTSLLGLLASLVDLHFGVLAGAAILLLIAFLNFHSVQTARKLEATTSVALIVVFLLGVLVGDGHLFTPIACAIVVTLLLSLKTQFHAFAGGLRQEEVQSAILLGLLGFVIWPLLPNRFVDPWGLLDPREAWVIVIVVASLGFINYVLLRVYGSKGIYPHCDSGRPRQLHGYRCGDGFNFGCRRIYQTYRCCCIANIRCNVFKKPIDFGHLFAAFSTLCGTPSAGHGVDRHRVGVSRTRKIE